MKGRDTVIVTGSGGLIGSETVLFFRKKGFKVIGIDNNMRKYFFGEGGDTSHVVNQLDQHDDYEHAHLDIRDRHAVIEYLKMKGDQVYAIIHSAAQPSHDWAAKEPFTDFDVNTVGTHNLLEAYRLHAPHAVFVFTSTNKVYGDRPNKVKLVEQELRFDYHPQQAMHGVSLQHGISEEMSIDASMHSLFGAGKVAADIFCQEYGRYFNLPIGVFRGGCLTGSNHSSVELHGFLSYIVKCAVHDKHYTIYGYKGKQVRDQIHSYDVANAFWHFIQKPRNGEAYNLGGGKSNAASIREVIEYLKSKHCLELQHSYSDANRKGDHICYYSDLRKLRSHYPSWDISISLPEIIDEIVAKELQKQEIATVIR